MRCARLGARSQGQRTRGDAQVCVRRNDIYVIRLDAQIVRHLVDRQGRRASEQPWERAVVHRIEVLHEYETHACVERQVLEQCRERLEPAGGRTDTHDRKRSASA